MSAGPRRGRHHEQARVGTGRASNPATAFVTVVGLLAIWHAGPGSGIASAAVDIAGSPSRRIETAGRAAEGGATGRVAYD